MSDAYVECLVKAKPSMLGKVGRGVLTTLMVICILTIFVLPPLMMFAFIGAVLFGVGAYFAKMFTDLEYEYLYLDKELEPDKAKAIKPAINCPKGAQVLTEGPVDFYGEQEKQKQDPQLPEEQSAGLSPEQRIGSQKRQGAKEGAGRA